MELINVTDRTPIYLGLITLSSALATVTVLWAGVIGFGLSALVLESVSRIHK